MKKNIKFIINAVSALIFIAIGIEAPVNAQQIDLSVSPPKLEVLVKPGAQLSIPYSITNAGDNVDFKLLVKTFSVVQQKKSVEYGSIEKLPMKFSFINENLETVETVTVSRGTVKNIFLQLDVSERATEGDYYIVFIVETQPDFLDKQFSSRIKSQIASPLLITITKTGKTQIRGAISALEVNGGIFDSLDSIALKLLVKNKGKNVANAGGSVTVRGSFGESAVYPLIDRNILTGSEILMTTQSAQDESTLTLKGFFVGRYGVSASVLLADGTVQLNKSTSFFAFPFKIVLFAVLCSFIGIMILRRKR